MERIVAAYLDDLSFDNSTVTAEIGAGAGAVTRRIATRSTGFVKAFEPSKGFVAEALSRVTGFDNLMFEAADGAALPLADASVDHVIMHTVLTHVPDPMPILKEAYRVLKPSGTVVVCDADFSKSTLASFANDPLDICARVFVSDFVTHPHIVGQLRPLLGEAGFSVEAFRFDNRPILDNLQMLPWVVETCKLMVARGQITQVLADTMAAEYTARAENGSLFGFQVFATAIARKAADS